MSAGRIPLVWRTREGTSIPIPELDDQHLKNIIAMLERDAEALRDNTVIGFINSPLAPTGEMASDDFDSAVGELAVMSPMSWLRRQPIYRALKREQAKRR